ncbi:epidermal growth factor receptor kinase substrate 8-like protein 3 [Mugil cephalus]|uniref:epidermal growth factor receptor kinase substrate 8-like protein 3 n=1 Tax=Mugil cephalus TaxID=48193 RepID=UPI001FB6FD80|nr:epidermal growth factor receptor kinase substrate 8-like protein 3 [Mugil cephalus]
MFRSDSPFGYDTSSYAESLHSNGYSTMDDTLSQVSSVSRPSARSIYMQRKEYASSINKSMDRLQYRVEHLFSCDLDGKELANISDCVERLKLLEETGRVWGQNMLLEVRGTNLLLKDIESQEELESIALSDIRELHTVTDIQVFNSLLVISFQSRRRNATTVLMFQCENIKAEYVEKDLRRVISRRRADPGSRAGQSVPQWTSPDYDEMSIIMDEDRSLFRQTPNSITGEPFPYTEVDRNVDIFNHILSDIEIFIGQVFAATGVKKKKKKKEKGKGMPRPEEFATCFHKIKCGLNLLGTLNGMIIDPSASEFVHTFFSAIGFLMSHAPVGLTSHIVAPLLTPLSIRFLSDEASPEEDELWQSLGDPWNVPSNKWHGEIPVYNLEFSDGWTPPPLTSVLPPSEPVSRQESPLGAFREPLSRQESPQPAFRAPSRSQESPLPGYGEPLRRQESPQPAFRREESPPPAFRREESPPPVFRREESPPPPFRSQESPLPEFGEPLNRQESPHPAPIKAPMSWNPPGPFLKARLIQPKLPRMRVKYDFISRNQRELTIAKGEIVELLDRSKQWWKVKNSKGEEGYVPHNVLEADDGKPQEDIVVSPILKKSSKPPEVKAWLEDQGFSPITVRCLGGLSGGMLLGMSREELKTVCTEEGGRVFFKLQAIKSTMAAASLT